MIVVDASVLIAFLDPNDGHHSSAVELLAEASPPLLVHPITAAEVLVAPARNGVADAVWADLEAIGVKIDDGPIDPWQLAEIRARSGCKMPDCCVLAVAATRRAPVATFDDQLRRHAPHH
ncbi:MAG: type II toxin-antitoxin system VapC family toxin [Acidimicrobiales bacterium]